MLAGFVLCNSDVFEFAEFPYILHKETETLYLRQTFLSLRGSSDHQLEKPPPLSLESSNHHFCAVSRTHRWVSVHAELVSAMTGLLVYRIPPPKPGAITFISILFSVLGKSYLPEIPKILPKPPEFNIRSHLVHMHLVWSRRNWTRMIWRVVKKWGCWGSSSDAVYGLIGQ